MPRPATVPSKETARRHIQWRTIRTYTTTFKAKPTKKVPHPVILTIHSIKPQPPTKLFKTANGQRKFKAIQTKTRLSKVIIVAKGRKTAVVTEDEIEEIEGLEDIDIEEDEEDEDETEDTDTDDEEEPDEEEDDEDEEPAPKSKKNKKSSNSTTSTTTTKTKTKKTPRDDGRIGTTELAEAAGVDSRTLRMVLRKHNIPKNSESNRYEWDSLENKTVQKVLKLIASGEAKDIKNESLQKLKDKKATEKAAQATTKTKTKKSKKAAPVEDDDEDDDE